MFFIMFVVFCIFRIKTAKFCLKYLFKKSFLWSEEEVDKYTKWSQNKHHENTQDLKHEGMGPIRDITNDPDDKAKPDNKEIHYHASE